MRKKQLFQKVIGITVTAILASNTCISPILADDIVEELEVQEASFEEDKESIAVVGDVSSEDVMELDLGNASEEEELFTDGGTETESENALVIDDGMGLSTQENVDQGFYIKKQPLQYIYIKKNMLHFYSLIMYNYSRRGQ